MVSNTSTQVKPMQNTESSSAPLGWRLLSVATFGVMLFGFAMIVLDTSVQSIFNRIIFGTPDYPADFSPDAIAYIRLAFGIVGAVMVGWMITVAYLVRQWRTNPQAIWTVIALSLGIWYVLDSGYSAYTGFYANVALNTGFLLLFAIPLMMILRQLRR